MPNAAWSVRSQTLSSHSPTEANDPVAYEAFFVDVVICLAALTSVIMP